MQNINMITYDYECSSCDHSFSVSQSIKDDALSKCPECKKKKLQRVTLEAPIAFVVGEPTTVGQMADRNKSKMGKYELDKRRKEDNAVEDKQNKEKSDLYRKINKMTPKQKAKWIKEG